MEAPQITALGEPVNNSLIPYNCKFFTMLGRVDLDAFKALSKPYKRGITYVINDTSNTHTVRYRKDHGKIAMETLSRNFVAPQRPLNSMYEWQVRSLAFIVAAEARSSFTVRFPDAYVPSSLDATFTVAFRTHLPGSMPQPSASLRWHQSGMLHTTHDPYKKNTDTILHIPPFTATVACDAPGGLLASDVGTGKTAVLLQRVIDTLGDGRTLIVVPNSLEGQWVCEMKRVWGDRYEDRLNPKVVADTPQKVHVWRCCALTKYWKPPARWDVLLTTFEFITSRVKESIPVPFASRGRKVRLYSRPIMTQEWAREMVAKEDYPTLLMDIQWNRLIVDEAEDAFSKMSQPALDFLTDLPCRHVWAMTATPANYPELATMMRLRLSSAMTDTPVTDDEDDAMQLVKQQNTASWVKQQDTSWVKQQDTSWVKQQNTSWVKAPSGLLTHKVLAPSGLLTHKVLAPSGLLTHKVLAPREGHDIASILLKYGVGWQGGAIANHCAFRVTKADTVDTQRTRINTRTVDIVLSQEERQVLDYMRQNGRNINDALVCTDIDSFLQEALANLRTNESRVMTMDDFWAQMRSENVAEGQGVDEKLGAIRLRLEELASVMAALPEHCEEWRRVKEEVKAVEKRYERQQAEHKKVASSEKFLKNLNDRIEDAQDNPCSICADDIQDGKMAITVCGHVFCIDCLKSWLDQNNMCPMCRRRPLLMSDVTVVNSLVVADAAVPQKAPRKYSTKIDFLLAHLRNLFATTDDKVIVFTHHAATLRKIYSVLKAEGISAARMTGNVHGKNANMIRFKDAPQGLITQSGADVNECRIMLLDTVHQNSGMDLIQANHVIFLDTHNVSVDAFTQGYGRCARLGQRKDINLLFIRVPQYENTRGLGAFLERLRLHDNTGTTTTTTTTSS